MYCYSRFIWVLLVAASSLLGITACGTDPEKAIAPPKDAAPTVADERPVVPDAQVLLTELPELRQTLYFEPQVFDLSVQQQLQIDPIAVRLRQHPDSYVIVVGHGNEFSDEDQNVAISYERAFSVAIYIASVFGIEEERIQVVAAGSTEATMDSRPTRVEIVSPKSIVRTLSPNTEPQF